MIVVSEIQNCGVNVLVSVRSRTKDMYARVVADVV